MPKASTGIQLAEVWPIRPLAVLGGGVLLAHLMLLHYVPSGLDFAKPIDRRAFITRTLQIAAVPAPAQQVAPPAVKPARRTSRGSVKTAVVAQAPTAAEPLPESEAPPSPDPLPVAETAPANQQSPATAEDTAAAAESAASAPITGAAGDTGTAPTLSKDAALAAHTYAVPGSIRLNFVANARRARFDASGQGVLLWQHDGDRYEARLELSSPILGKRVATSAGRITADGLAPTRYSDRDRAEQASHFDRENGKIIFSSNATQAELLPGAQDQLSVVIQLSALIAGEPLKYPVGSSAAFQTIGRRSADHWVFTVMAEELLSLPGGELATLKLVRNPRKEFDQTVEIWLAPALSYLPARMRVTLANGDFIEQRWSATAAP